MDSAMCPGVCPNVATARTPGTISEVSPIKVSRSSRGFRFRRAVSTMKGWRFLHGIIRVPEVPLLLRDEVAGIAENESFLLIQHATDVIRVSVGDNDRVDLGKL